MAGRASFDNVCEMKVIIGLGVLLILVGRATGFRSLLSFPAAANPVRHQCAERA